MSLPLGVHTSRSGTNPYTSVPTGLTIGLFIPGMERSWFAHYQQALNTVLVSWTNDLDIIQEG